MNKKKRTTGINQGKANEMLAYLVREHNKTSQTRNIRKIPVRTKKTKMPTGVLKSVMQEDQQGCMFLVIGTHATHIVGW